MSEDQLIATINETIDLWVSEELLANDDSVSPEQRINETRTSFIAELLLTWGDN
jgi:hypothetical protein